MTILDPELDAKDIALAKFEDRSRVPPGLPDRYGTRKDDALDYAISENMRERARIDNTPEAFIILFEDGFYYRVRRLLKRGEAPEKIETRHLPPRGGPTP